MGVVAVVAVGVMAVACTSKTVGDSGGGADAGRDAAADAGGDAAAERWWCETFDGQNETTCACNFGVSPSFPERDAETCPASTTTECCFVQGGTCSCWTTADRCDQAVEVVERCPPPESM